MNREKKEQYEELIRSAIKISEEKGILMAVQVSILEDGRINLSIGPQAKVKKAINAEMAQGVIIGNQAAGDTMTETKKTRKEVADYDDFDLEEIISDELHKIGVPAHILGYRYIKTALLISIRNLAALDSITKILYPTIAKQYESVPSRVERAIRHAIEIAWSRGNMEYIDKLFGYTINMGKGKPTNSEFIALLQDKIYRDLRRDK